MLNRQIYIWEIIQACFMIYSIFSVQRKKKPHRVTSSPSIFSSTFFCHRFLSSDLRTVRISSLPYKDRTLFLRLVKYFGNIKPTGRGKLKKNPDTPYPLPTTSPAFPWRSSLLSCLLLLNLGLFQTHSLFGLWAAWRNKRESLQN